MLTNLKTILEYAEIRKCAIGSFNTPNLEGVQAVLRAAEELNEPVIISHAQVHEDMGLCKMEEIAPIMLFMAERAAVPVCVHLDHGTDINYIKRGIELGFTSVMYDGSGVDMALNIINTSLIVDEAHRNNVSVEAEVGSMGKSEGGQTVGESIYTDCDTALDFVNKTNVDALACAFGTAHGVYLKKPKLDIERVKNIKNAIKIPIVMHGGSGISEQDYYNAINAGVRKINYYTYMSKAAGDAVNAMKDRSFFHDIVNEAKKAITEDVKKAMTIFSKSQK